MVALAIKLFGAVFPWRWLVIAGLGLGAAGTVYVQSLRLEAAQADSRAYKASADNLMGNLKMIDAQAKENEAQAVRVTAENATAHRDLSAARAARKSSAEALSGLLIEKGMEDASLRACFARTLPADVLRSLNGNP